MNALAVVLQQPEQIILRRLDITAPTDDDVVVDIAWSGISTGTERLLWTGRMPAFPGMGYPLVPGYESVGRVSHAGSGSGSRVGDLVFVPGAKCFGDVRGLFGGAASRVGLGVFYEGLRFSRFSAGPFAGVEYVFSDSLRHGAGLVGFRTVLYAKKVPYPAPAPVPSPPAAVAAPVPSPPATPAK